MSGGAGYVLSRYAFTKFVTEGLPVHNFCSEVFEFQKSR